MIDFSLQNGIVIWLTGLSGAGKSTIALALKDFLDQHNIVSKILDGDDLRKGLNKDLGFDLDDRKENIRRVSEVANILAETGIVTICCFITPTEKIREIPRQNIENNYFEIFVNTPIEICEKRDIKGLYKKARNGEISDFTGVSAPFEIPLNSDLVINTMESSVEDAVNTIFKSVKEMILMD